jgi:hypothetical protein
VYSEDTLAVNDVLAQCGRQCWGSKGMHWQGRGPALPGLKDIGIRDSTFTFLLGVVIVGVGCGAAGGGRGDDGVVVDTVACEVG